MEQKRNQRPSSPSRKPVRKVFDYDTAKPERTSKPGAKEQMFTIPVGNAASSGRAHTTGGSRPACPRQGNAVRKNMGTSRKKRKKGNGCGFFLGAFVVILLLAIPITALLEAPGKLATSDSSGASQPADSGSQVLTEQSDSSSGQQTPPTSQVSGLVGPQIQQDVGAVLPITASLVSLWENGRVDMSYFDDALFIGDSLTQGFQIYNSSFKNAKYAAYVGVGPKELTEGTVTNVDGQQVTAIDEILAANATKVYILLGTNSLQNLTDEAFIKYYNDFLDYLIGQLPKETVYYIQAIPPVSAEKAAEDENYQLSRIQSVNDQLAQMAYSRGLNFVNLYQALSGEDGALLPEYVAGDGIHLNDAGYDAWREYLITHTAYKKENPYLIGSPLYLG
ncbi:GDSL-type esterase/lipase family protein [uncultured Ruthenibacterium sp.]|uniref:GDSL-type esterase/lipase family protein n=1 Tax=uncultured Ruthenibacterium sp. TaxID=1905347 RepID=UPI00349ED3E7